jgi:hypothetical protein
MSTLPHDHSGSTSTVHTGPTSMAPGVRRIDDVVGEFIAAAEEMGVSRPSELDLRSLCRQIADLTSGLFPGELTVKFERDREDPGDIYFVLDVGATGDIDAILARTREWHLAVRQLAGRHADLFCLSTDAH